MQGVNGIGMSSLPTHSLILSQKSRYYDWPYWHSQNQSPEQPESSVATCPHCTWRHRKDGCLAGLPSTQHEDGRHVPYPPQQTGPQHPTQQGKVNFFYTGLKYIFLKFHYANLKAGLQHYSQRGRTIARIVSCCATHISSSHITLALDVLADISIIRNFVHNNHIITKIDFQLGKGSHVFRTIRCAFNCFLLVKKFYTLLRFLL